MADYKIYPVFLGENDMDNAFLVSHGEPGMTVRIGIGAIALKNSDTGEVIMLDTGECPYKEAVKNEYDFYKYDEKAPGMKELTLKMALGNIGIDPEQVIKIGISHLHWDHCWNWELFNADVPIYVQKTELQHAITCWPPEKEDYQRHPKIKDGPVYLKKWNQLVLKDGDYELAPGIQVLHTPGHTPGSQSFVISTKEGPYIYTGDQYYGEVNWEGEGRITGWYTSLEDWYQSHNRLKSLKAKGFLSVHDLNLYSRVCYG